MRRYERFQPVKGDFEPWYSVISDSETDYVFSFEYECPHCAMKFSTRIAAEKHCKGQVGMYPPTCKETKRGGRCYSGCHHLPSNDLDTLSDALWMIREQNKINEQEESQNQERITFKTYKKDSTASAKLSGAKTAENAQLFEIKPSSDEQNTKIALDQDVVVSERVTP